MLHQNTNLFLPEHLANAKRMSELAETDREALRVVADWTKTFVAKPHSDLGRSGPWITKTGSGFGRIATQTPQLALLQRNYVACRGAQLLNHAPARNRRLRAS